jgi:protein tyrosine phosphatase type 4A
LLIRIVEKSLLYEINVPNLTVVDFTNFEDGSVPTKEIMDKYIKLIEDIKVKYTNPIVAIHCVSSLGRCPTFLGISMIIEHSKMDRYEIIIYIRKKRPGALNAKQVNWLIDVKIPSKKKSWEFWKK